MEFTRLQIRFELFERLLGVFLVSKLPLGKLGEGLFLLVLSLNLILDIFSGPLSGKPGDSGRNAEDNRRFVNAMYWIARTGAPWADLPERFGKYDTVYQRFNR